MILNELTEQHYGYSPKNLTKGSNKKIKVKCDYCGKILDKTMKIRNKLNQVIDKDCCGGCKAKKREEICLKEYGVSNPFQREDVKEKIKKINREKYGVDAITQSEYFKQKSDDTMIKRYGVVNAMHSNKIKNKHKETILDKYGVDNISQLPEVRKKIKETNLEKYGNEEFLASDYAREKLKESMQEKYGVDNPFQADEIKQKSKQTHIEKRGIEHHMKDKGVAKLVSEKTTQTKINKGQIKLYNGKTAREWLKESGYSNSRFRVLIKKHGFDQAILMTPNKSSLEQILSSWLDEIEIKYESQKRIYIDNRFFIPDFFLSDYNILIELDGLYWHSDAICEDSAYHIKKKEAYNSLGFRSLFFRENEINNKLDIVKSIILNKCGLSNRMFARQCTVRDDIDLTDFMNTNHLMGNGSGQDYCLELDGKIVAGMQVRRRKNNDWEISRFATLVGNNVIGGFSRLLTCFERKCKPDNLITFIDCRYGVGDYLIRFNFLLQSCHVSFQWTDSQNLFHRMRYPGNTGYNHGLFKLWDCGQAKYTKSYK